MHLIVGLGNPGPKYERNRHNIGFMVIDRLIERLKPTSISKKEFKGELYKAGSLFLLKPLTYMNLSGQSVLAVKNFYKIDIENIIVVHDDLDLGLGALRFKKGGSSGGHNGLKSIDALIGKEYIRIRFGIGRPQRKEDVVRYVLSDFTQKELECIVPVIDKAADAALALTRLSLDEVRSQYSQKQLNCP
ncbi:MULTISPECIES: aminoacyl-tRNA hydrolase [unclassified Nitratiruptor]|uniref:aminoacyl-tRNA hydrolase n=1 Tax=unclassified Nitratiruptor TaxID=2624044 RepID=UPI0019168BAF|nr:MULTISPECIES: aminoacyl-tRNA hydrolase [unclassified Nitratiruptor]BCD59722.1 peptidyl-tRNA hydrolase, PTH1 family [Nitratiruptor sp. YY08-10]BCD63646.1 peptidyl-tRNA hydrolase, PTH1 family [Nitratiruptor sp. YY08-14]